MFVSQKVKTVVSKFLPKKCDKVSADNAKIVGLLPSRNESVMIGQCLRCLSMFTDAIVYLDDASTDNSLEVVYAMQDKCNIEKIITKEKWYRDEPGDRNLLLDTGRQIGGTHFIVIDADEILTSNFLSQDRLRKKILSLRKGDKISLNWIMLWRSLDQFRFDDSVWTYKYKDFIFCDDTKCRYDSDFIHTPRIPTGLKGRSCKIRGYQQGMLHLQFVNWKNLLVKNAWYCCLERIRQPEKSAAEINNRYAIGKSEENIRFKKSKQQWLSAYDFFDSSIYSIVDDWRKTDIQVWFEQYGKDYFADLNIWDIDWDE